MLGNLLVHRIVKQGIYMFTRVYLILLICRKECAMVRQSAVYSL